MASSEREQRKREQRARKAYGLIRLGERCVKCGECDTDLLQFDHIDKNNKEFEISRAWCYTFAKFLKELMKCQLLCIECHKWKSNLERRHVPWQAIQLLIEEYKKLGVQKQQTQSYEEDDVPF